MTKKISLKEVAEELGVSKTLVSFVINGKAKEKGISKTTEKRVLDKVDEMGYQPNNIARNLRTGKSKAIGVIVSDISNAYYSTICRNIENYFIKIDYNVVFCSSDEDPEKEKKHIQHLYERGIDGIILSPTRKYSSELKEEFQQFKEFPIVFIDRYYPTLKIPAIISNNELTCKQVTEYLINKGHENIGLILQQPIHTSTNKDKLIGFKEGLNNNEMRFNKNMVREIPFHFEKQALFKEVRDLIRDTQCTAIISTNNRITTPIVEYFHDFEIKIPEDIAIVSFDYLDTFKIANPPISSVQLFAEKIGCSAAETLYNRILDPEEKIENQVINSVFHVRASS